jgi:hypothetical protein
MSASLTQEGEKYREKMDRFCKIVEELKQKGYREDHDSVTLVSADGLVHKIVSLDGTIKEYWRR